MIDHWLSDGTWIVKEYGDSWGNVIDSLRAVGVIKPLFDVIEIPVTIKYVDLKFKVLRVISTNPFITVSDDDHTD